MEAGHTADAAVALETLVKLYPEVHTGYYYLAVSRKFNSDDPLIPQLRALEEKTSEESNASVNLNFALGKIYDDCKQWDAAFLHYAKGNRVKNLEYDYQPQRKRRNFEKLISLFSREFMDGHRELGIPSNLPVLIVGMPRSGTTLTEQIVSSHPSVIGAGEVVFWPKALGGLPYMLGTSTPYPECMAYITPGKAAELAERYVEQLKKSLGRILTRHASRTSCRITS